MPQHILTFFDDDALDQIIEFMTVDQAVHVMHYFSTASDKENKSGTKPTTTIIGTIFNLLLRERIYNAYHEAVILGITNATTEEFYITGTTDNRSIRLKERHSLIIYNQTFDEFSDPEVIKRFTNHHTEQGNKVLVLVNNPNPPNAT